MTARRFYMDMDPRDRVGIQRGDLLIGPNVTKLVLDAWPTESRTATNRWTLTVQPLGRRPTSPTEWQALRSHGREDAREIFYESWPRR